MRRIIGVVGIIAGLGGTALAADLPPVAAPPRAPAAYVPAALPIFNWTGFYIGGNLGAAWASRCVGYALTG
jgi:outer membrane immunogenic protein